MAHETSDVGRGSALADALILSNVLTTALDENGWRVTGIRVAEFRDRPHHEINGVVMFERETFPFPGKGYGTARWDVQQRGVTFFAGNYDLTREEAGRDFNKRGLD